MPPKKEEPKVDVFAEVIIILLTVFFLGLVALRLEAYLAYWQLGSFGTLWQEVWSFFAQLWPYVEILFVLAGLASIVGIFYNQAKIKAINEEENKIYNPVVTSATSVPMPVQNTRWEKIVAQANSINPADWRSAIIDADVMLEELLRSKNYHGDGVGEMLKSVDKSDFLTLDSAWDAHKVRNQIAHPTPDFDLTSRETARVIAEFEAVFKEFQII
jgi:hypothetical protein